MFWDVTILTFVFKDCAISNQVQDFARLETEELYSILGLETLLLHLMRWCALHHHHHPDSSSVHLLLIHHLHWQVPAHHCSSQPMPWHCWACTTHPAVPLYTPPFPALSPQPCQPITISCHPPLQFTTLHPACVFHLPPAKINPQPIFPASRSLQHQCTSPVSALPSLCSCQPPALHALPESALDALNPGRLHLPLLCLALPLPSSFLLSPFPPRCTLILLLQSHSCVHKCGFASINQGCYFG